MSARTVLSLRSEGARDESFVRALLADRHVVVLQGPFAHVADLWRISIGLLDEIRGRTRTRGVIDDDHLIAWIVERQQGAQTGLDPLRPIMGRDG